MNKYTFALMGGLLISGLMADNALAQAPAEKKPEAKPAAPGAPGARPAMRDRSEMLAKRLNLNDDQKSKAKEILDEEMKKMMELRTTKGLTAQERQAKYKELRESTTGKMKDVLTPEQFQQYTKMFTPPAMGSRPNAAPGAGAKPAATPAPAAPAPAEPAAK